MPIQNSKYFSNSRQLVPCPQLLYYVLFYRINKEIKKRNKRKRKKAFFHAKAVFGWGYLADVGLMTEWVKVLLITAKWIL